MLAQILLYAGTDEPEGWLICDGRAVSRETYADLYGEIGDFYGSGDGSTTFNLPDYTNRSPLGEDEDYDVSVAGGNDEELMTEERMPEHGHELLFEAVPNHSHTGNVSNISVSGNVSGNTNNTGAHTHTNNPNYNGNTSGVANGGTNIDNRGNQNTWDDGNHSHPFSGTVSGNASGNYTINSGGAHTPSGSASAEGGAEAIPVRQPTLFMNIIIGFEP
jgi:microcystin-dependent protein